MPTEDLFPLPLPGKIVPRLPPGGRLSYHMGQG